MSEETATMRGKIRALLMSMLDGVTVLDKEGELHRVDPPVSVITAALAYLKAYPEEDKGLTANEMSDQLKRYGGKMKFPSGAAPN